MGICYCMFYVRVVWYDIYWCWLLLLLLLCLLLSTLYKTVVARRRVVIVSVGGDTVAIVYC